MVVQISRPSRIDCWEIHVLNERPLPSRSAPCHTSSQDGAWLLSQEWAVDHLTDTLYKNVLINVSQPYFSAKRSANLRLSYINVRRFSQSWHESETWTIEHPSMTGSWSPGGWGTENISRKTLEWRESMLRCTRNWVCSACITTLPSSNQIFERVMRSGSMVVGSIWLYLHVERQWVRNWIEIKYLKSDVKRSFELVSRVKSACLVPIFVLRRCLFSDFVLKTGLVPTHAL